MRCRIDLAVRVKAEVATFVLEDVTDTSLTRIEPATMRTRRRPDNVGFAIDSLGECRLNAAI